MRVNVKTGREVKTHQMGNIQGLVLASNGMVAWVEEVNDSNPAVMRPSIQEVWVARTPASFANPTLLAS